MRVHSCPLLLQVPVNCMWAVPVLLQMPRLPEHVRPRSGLGTAPQLATVVCFRHGLPNWQKSNVVLTAPPSRTCLAMGVASQSIDEAGFSKKQGVRDLRAARINRAEANIVELPTAMRAASAGLRLGIPSKNWGDRMRHQLEPGGPRRARDQEEHGVPNHSPATQPPESQPSMRESTCFLVTSHSRPKRISRLTAAHPRRRMAAESPPDPEKTSTKTSRLDREADLRAALKAACKNFTSCFADPALLLAVVALRLNNFGLAARWVSAR
jgi:hypothetical protein